MYNLPAGNSVLYPDGTYGPRPSDGTYFIGDGMRGYTWDGLLMEWVDHKGEIFRPSPKHWQELQRPEKKCECGAHKVGVDKHATWCQLYSKDQR